MKYLLYVLMVFLLISPALGQISLVGEENNTEVQSPADAVTRLSEKLGSTAGTVTNLSQDVMTALQDCGAYRGQVDFEKLNRRLWTDPNLSTAVRDSLQNYFPGVTANTKFQFYGNDEGKLNTVGVYTDVPADGAGREQIRNMLLNGRLGDSEAIKTIADAGFFDKAKNHPMFFDMALNVSDGDISPAERVGVNVGYGNRPSQALKFGHTYVHASPGLANDLKDMFIGDKLGQCFTTDPKSGSTMSVDNLTMQFRDGQNGQNGSLRFYPDFTGRTPENPRNPGGNNFQYGSNNCNGVYMDVTANPTEQRNVFNFDANIGGGGWTESSRPIALAQKIGTNIFGGVINGMGNKLQGMINSNDKLKEFVSLPNGVKASLGANTWFSRNGLFGLNATSGFNLGGNFNADVDLGGTIDKHWNLPGGVKPSEVITVDQLNMNQQGVGIRFDHADMLQRGMNQVTEKVGPAVEGFKNMVGPDPQ